MNKIEVEVSKYNRRSRDELAGHLEREVKRSLPLYLPVAFFPSLANTIAAARRGRLVFGRTGGEDLHVCWATDNWVVTITWRTATDDDLAYLNLPKEATP